MRSIYLLGILLYLLNCNGGNTKDSENGKPTTRAMNSEGKEAVPKAIPITPETIPGCGSFTSIEDCVNAKEINFTLAYYQGSKGDPQVISMTKEASRPQIVKLKSSNDLGILKKRMVDESYIASPDKATKDEIIQYLQDDKEGQSLGKTATEFKNDKLAAARALQEANAKKKPSDDSDALKKMRERMQKEIDAHPFTFEISCANFDDSKDIPTLDQCVSKLKPSLKVTSDKKVVYNFTYTDFISGPVNSQLKLPADFVFELTSTSQDSSKLLVALIKNRAIKEDSGKLYFSTDKVFTRMGQNIIIKP
jgi:hypothetical protein